MDAEAGAPIGVGPCADRLHDPEVREVVHHQTLLLAVEQRPLVLVDSSAALRHAAVRFTVALEPGTSSIAAQYNVVVVSADLIVLP